MTNEIMVVMKIMESGLSHHCLKCTALSQVQLFHFYLFKNLNVCVGLRRAREKKCNNKTKVWRAPWFHHWPAQR